MKVLFCMILSMAMMALLCNAQKFNNTWSRWESDVSSQQSEPEPQQLSKTTVRQLVQQIASYSAAKQKPSYENYFESTTFSDVDSLSSPPKKSCGCCQSCCKKPSISPTSTPLADPSASPSEYPTPYPSVSPSQAPSAAPSSAEPSQEASSVAPSQAPSAQPSRNPSTSPSREPTRSPSTTLSRSPTGSPTVCGLPAITGSTTCDHLDFSSGANNEAYWGPSCFKDDAIGTANVKTVVTTENFARVIVKAGSDSCANTIFTNVPSGFALYADTDCGCSFTTGDRDISHIIYCCALPPTVSSSVKPTSAVTYG